MIRIMRPLLFIVLATIPTAALAQAKGPAIPYHDVDRACLTAGGLIERRKCIELEQKSYDRLKAIWPTSSPSARKRAIFSAQDPDRTATFYQTLLSVLGIAQTLEDALGPSAPMPEFKR